LHSFDLNGIFKLMSFKIIFLSIKLLCPVLMIGLLFPFNSSAQSDAHSPDSAGSGVFQADPFGGDPFGGMIDSTVAAQPLQNFQSEPSNSMPAASQPSIIESPAAPAPTTQTQSVQTKKAELPFSSAASRETPPVSNEPSAFQNAIIEGIQLTSEKGSAPDEKIISCYFIFRDKPSMYFYEVKIREKQLVFEFNDTRTGSSPVPTVSELPIKGFKIESGKVDLNKEVKGLLPEWHDMIKVTFDLEAVPNVHVSDEYSIISFSFKWSSDPQKIKHYTVKDNSRKIMFLSAGGVAGIGVGVLAYVFLKPEPPKHEEKPIDISDIPLHTTGK
jgi:hypothetical protein